MPDIYEQHKAAFSAVSAFVILKDGERVATIAFKFPMDGAGRLYAYVHWIGTEMVRGFASGGGYDKQSAAVAYAARKIKGGDGPTSRGMGEYHACKFIEATSRDDGYTWDRCLRDAGFIVLQAV